MATQKKKKTTKKTAAKAVKKTAKKAAKKAPAKKTAKKSKRKSAEPEAEIWQVEGHAEQFDRFLRGHYIIPCLLNDIQTDVYIKAVILDMSATGCRVFTNDRRVRIMDRKLLVGRTFDFEFDFYDIDTDGIEVTVQNVTPGKNPLTERQLGLEFSLMDDDIRKRIRDKVQADVAFHKA